MLVEERCLLGVWALSQSISVLKGFEVFHTYPLIMLSSWSLVIDHLSVQYSPLGKEFLIVLLFEQ